MGKWSPWGPTKLWDEDKSYRKEESDDKGNCGSEGSVWIEINEIRCILWRGMSMAIRENVGV